MAASVWRGRITFGLVSIPVRLVKAARRERTRFRRVQRQQAAIEDDFEMPEAAVQSPRVLEFPAAGRASTATFLVNPADDSSLNEQVRRVRNTPMSEVTE